MSLRTALLSLILVFAPFSAPAGRGVQAGEPTALLARDNLVAWCIVPFDASKRGPHQRAQMLERLGLRKVAYDWRDEHVPTFEEEILAYQQHNLEFFAFWSWHPSMADLIRKYKIRPQIWQTNPSPAADSNDQRIRLAAHELLPLVVQTRQLGCQLGLYNHGGWGGEPENLIAVCQWLRDHAGGQHVGIVYNFHHGHDHIHDFAESLERMKPYLICVNLNGMNDDANPKILPIGGGQHERKMIQIVLASGYRGPIGILDHRSELDAEESLRQNLDGLDRLAAELRAK